MNVSLILGVAAVVIPGALGWAGLRYVIRKDRLDGQDAARAEQERQQAAIRQAVADAVKPKDDEITQLRIDKRYRDERIDDLLDELRRPRPGGHGD